MHERGSALPLVSLALGIVLLAALLLSAAAQAVHDRARAQTAADAAALAGVVDGPGAARELAAANGGELVGLAEEGDGIVVRVRVGRAVAEARATLELGAAPVPVPDRP